MRRIEAPRIVLVILLLALGGVLSIAFLKRGVSVPLSLLLGLALCIVVVAGFVAFFALSLAIHEVGHLLAVWAVRWRPVQFSAIGLTVTKTGDKASIQYDLNTFFRGAVAYWPNDLSISKMAFVHACGPAANLLAAALCLLLLNQNPTGAARPLIQWQIWLQLLAAVASLIPAYSMHSRRSDGLVLYSALKRKSVCETTLAIANLSRLLYCGRPRDWRDDDLAVAFPSKAHAAYVRLNRFWSKMDKREFNEARADLDEAWNRLVDLEPSKETMGLIAWEAAVYYTRFDEDRAKAEAAVCEGMRLNPNCHVRESADIARYYVDGNAAEARRLVYDKIAQIRSDKNRRPYQAEYEIEWYETLVDDSVPVLNRSNAEQSANLPPRYPR